jgi:hypothetical protein
MNSTVGKLLTVVLFALLSAAMSVLPSALAEGFPEEKQAPVPEGTVITTQNWEQYKDYMPLWMQWLFSGQYFFKLASDQKIIVGPATPKSLPKAYLANTEKYAAQVRLKELPDGGTIPLNYIAGRPFPNPTDPHMGEKILWNVWYRYAPRIEEMDRVPEFLVDHYHHMFVQVIEGSTQRLGHISEPDEPIYNKDVPDLDFAQYVEIRLPEQSKYTVSLTIFYTDPTKVQEIWSFVPSLRRPLRLSAASRCSPSLGTDLAIDDQKGGFNIMPSDFNGKVVAHKKLLVVDNMQPAWPQTSDFTRDMSLVKAWGVDSGAPWPPIPQNKWELRDHYVVEVTRVPAKRVGYCYGLRRMYVDTLDYTLSEDLYDMSTKPWKMIYLINRMHPNNYGDYFMGDSSNYVFVAMDLQNNHFTFIPELTGDHVNHAAPSFWYNVKRYAQPTGLLEVMQ